MIGGTNGWQSTVNSNNRAYAKEQVVALLDKVIRPPGTILPSGATEQNLLAFTASTGLSLSIELAEWLRVCNGPCIGPGGLYGVAPASRWLTIEAHLETEPEWKQRGWFPIAGDGNGNQYVLDSNAGREAEHPIYFLDHETSLLEPVYVVASNLWHFLRFLLQDDLDREHGGKSGWPFDKAVVLVADPEIESFGDIVPLPWKS